MNIEFSYEFREWLDMFTVFKQCQTYPRLSSVQI